MIKRNALIFALLLPAFAMAQDVYQLDSHEITIRGTSNLQSWSAEVEQVEGDFLLVLEDGLVTEIQNIQFRADATSIKGSEGRRMDAKIYETLKTDKHPEITFVLREILALYENPGTARVTSRGVLTLAGVSRVIELQAVGVVLPDGSVRFSGTHALKMSDFRMSAPTAMFGALRTGDEVEIDFSVILKNDQSVSSSM